MDNLEMPINLPCMSLDWGRKPEYPEETPKGRGEHANSTHTAEAGIEPPTLEFEDDPFLFQHDCTPVTKASSIKTWMSEFGVEELDWPAQSPDLNPIEHLWDELERRLRARPSRPTSVPDLTNALLEERSKIPINTLLNLVESLPRRVEAVIAAKGGTTPYYIHFHLHTLP
ncbi:hypothetical protein QTP70_030801, partial [Hemibagrus guttatus]